jgi:hypothetical protein
MNERRQKEDTRVHTGSKGPPHNANAGGLPRQPPGKKHVDMHPMTDADKKRKRVEKKMGKREKQLATMKKKADEEDKFFRQCQREAAQERHKRVKTSPDADKKRELELFGTQGAQGIDFAKYDEIKVEVKKGSGTSEAATDKGLTGFDQIDLHPIIRRNIGLMRYATPTPIQRHSIPIALDGNDLMCCAQTGSGKTCAFLLPVIAALSKIKPNDDAKNANANGEIQGASPRCVWPLPGNSPFRLSSKRKSSVTKYHSSNPWQSTAERASGVKSAISPLVRILWWRHRAGSLISRTAPSSNLTRCSF